MLKIKINKIHFLILFGSLLFSKLAFADLQAQASVNGKYSGLIAEVPCPGDEKKYGKKFIEAGGFKAQDYCGKRVEQGYWVFVAPTWYVWANKKGGPSANAAPKSNGDIVMTLGSMNYSTAGNVSVLAKAPKRILVEDFSIWYRTYDYEKSGSVSIDTYMEIDDKLAKLIAQGAYMYLVKSFAAAGYEVVVLDAERIKKNKIFIDYSEDKDGAIIYNNDIVNKKVKMIGSKKSKIEYKGAYAKDVNSVLLEPGIFTPQRHKEMVDAVVNDKTIPRLKFSAMFSFAEYTPASVGNYSNLNTKPILHLQKGDLTFGQSKISFAGKDYSAGYIDFEHPGFFMKGTSWLGKNETVEKAEYSMVLQYTASQVNFGDSAYALIQQYINELVTTYIKIHAEQLAEASSSSSSASTSATDEEDEDE